MRIQQTFYQSGIDLWNTETHTALKSMTATQPHSVNNAADYASISEEGRQALREKVTEYNPEPEDITVYKITTKNTNEIEWEHYMAMRELQITPYEGKEYNVEDMMSSLADAYETLYNRIIEEHKNEDRQVTYDIAGESSVTLEEDLEGSDKAYKRSLTNLAGYITVQQTNKAFANPDNAWYLKRMGMQPSEENSKDLQNIKQEDCTSQEYINTIISVMEQAHEDFLALYRSPDYHKGAMKGIIFDMINRNADRFA